MHFLLHQPSPESLGIWESVGLGQTQEKDTDTPRAAEISGSLETIFPLLYNDTDLSYGNGKDLPKVLCPFTLTLNNWAVGLSPSFCHDN